MKNLKAIRACPYGPHHYQAGDLIKDVPDTDADLLINLKRAVPLEDEVTFSETAITTQTASELSSKPDASTGTQLSRAQKRAYKRRDLKAE